MGTVVALKCGIRGFTPAERQLLEVLLAVLARRVGGGYQMEFHATDAGDPWCAYTLGYHTCASFVVTKARTEFVMTRWDGAVVSRGPKLLDTLSMCLDAGAGTLQTKAAELHG